MIRFLLPAGYLPLLAPYSVFNYYEELRKKTGAAGYEYFYMVDQDAQSVNDSPIGGKIFGVHGPWTQLESYYQYIFRPKVASNLEENAAKTLKFAKAVGASYVIFHSIDVVDSSTFLKNLTGLAKSLKIKLYLEPDIKKPGLPSWYYNPLALAKKFRLPVVFDPATVEWNGGNLSAQWQKVAPFIRHVHLNEYQPELNKDQGVLKSKRYADLIREIGASGYSGFFTFEVGPLQNHQDFIIAGLFFAACLFHLTDIFPNIQQWYARRAQKNLSESILFSQKYL